MKCPFVKNEVEGVKITPMLCRAGSFYGGHHDGSPCILVPLKTNANVTALHVEGLGEVILAGSSYAILAVRQMLISHDWEDCEPLP